MPDATDVGSIVGYLRLNDSEWNETLDRAEARARELGRVDPNIHIDADNTTALAKIEAVRAAEAQLGGINPAAGGAGSAAKIDSVAAAQKRLETAERAAANAASAQYLAELRLEDVQGRRSKTAYLLASAEEAVARSTRNADAAETRHMAASTALAAAQQAAARAALEESAAQQEDAASTDKANTSKGLSINRTGLIIAGIAALIPLAAALTGYVVGAGGALAGMGAAGILAIVGIKNAMAAGTDEGQQYRAGIQTLKGDLDQLSGTAAVGMLGWFQQAVRLINGSLPTLNQQVSQFTTLLGSSGVRALDGVLNALRVLNPLFLQAGVYIEQVAAGFQSWTTNGGLQQFANDAIRSFPLVANAIGSILSVTMHLIEVLAPVGTLMLFTLTAAADLANVLLSVLQPPLVIIAAGALAVWTAFQVWGNISPKIMDAAKAAVAFATELLASVGVVGALGVAVGVVALAIVGWNAVMAAQKAFSQAAALATQDYTASIIADSGAIKENTVASIAKNLHDSGAIENAHKLGISTQTLTQAILGNKDATERVNLATKAATNGSKEQADQLKKTGLNLTELGIAQQWVRDAVKNNTDAVQEGVTTYKAIQDAQDATTGSSKEHAAAQKALAAQYGITVDQLGAAETAQKQNADQAAATTRQLQFENDAAGLLTNAFTLLNGGTLNVAQAQTGAAAATNSLMDAFKENGAAIDGNSKAAVANQQAIQQKVQADQQAAEAIAKQTGSTEAGTKAFGDAKVALEEQLRVQGLLTPAVQAYIEKLYAVPPVVKTKAELDADAAIQKADALKAALEHIAQVWTVPVKIVTSGNLPTAGHLAATSATGGPVRESAYRAGGGSIVTQYRESGGTLFRPQGTDTVPTMLTPGEFVVKEPSARYDPQFLKAYNADPRKALDAAASHAGGKAPTVNNFYISQADNPDAVAQRVLHALESSFT